MVVAATTRYALHRVEIEGVGLGNIFYIRAPEQNTIQIICERRGPRTAELYNKGQAVSPTRRAFCPGDVCSLQNKRQPRKRATHHGTENRMRKYLLVCSIPSCDSVTAQS